MGTERGKCRHLGLIPIYPIPVMQNAAHPVTTEVPPGYDGTTSWFKYSDAWKNGVISPRLKPNVVVQESRLVQAET